jgi:ribonuclease HI
MTEERKHVLIYTDGACEPNPGGSGGYGAIVIYGDKRKEISGGFRATTNNRMEILSAIKGLESLKTPCKVTLHSDSAYLVDSMREGWARRWKQNNWWRKGAGRVANVDLWERLLSLCDIHSVEFVWVKGHAGNFENEKADTLSYQARREADLPPDDGYEQREAEEANAQITKEGQPCRKCLTPVVKIRNLGKPEKQRRYFYEYYLYCPNCDTSYQVEEAKRDRNEGQGSFEL